MMVSLRARDRCLSPARALGVLAGLGLLLVGCGADADLDASSATPRAITFERLDGGRGSLVDFRGRPLVVNFFASWCTPCLTEMPAFEKVHKRFGSRVTFLGLAVRDTPQEARKVADRTGVTWALGRDPNAKIVRELDGIGMPTTALLDEKGRLVDSHTGELSGGQLTKLLERRLGVKAPPPRSAQAPQ